MILGSICTILLLNIEVMNPCFEFGNNDIASYTDGTMSFTCTSKKHFIWFEKNHVKTSVLGCIAEYKNPGKHRMLSKVFIESQFNYCPLI